MKIWMAIILLACLWNISGADYSDQMAKVKSGELKEARAEWWGFQTEDTTRSLQNALNSGVSKLIISKQAGPWLISQTLQIPGNIEIFLEDGAEIKAADGHFTGLNDSLFKINGKSKVTIRGKGILTMNRKNFQNSSQYRPSEWRHNIEIVNCKDILLEGLTLDGSGGDGVYINNVTDILIDNLKTRNHHRQGISVISAENLTVRNSIFTNTAGAAPMAGIDFEPNHENERLINCLVENCQFTNNAGAGIDLILIQLTGRTRPISITFRNCLIKNNQRGITIMNNHMPAVKGSIVFENCRVEDSRIYTVNSIGQTADGYSVTMQSCVLDNRKTQNPSAFILTPGFVSGALGNLHFKDLKVLDQRPNPVVFGFDSWRLYPLKNLTGSLISPSGKQFELSTLEEKSRRSNPVASAQLNPADLRPRSSSLKKSNPQSLRMRFGGSFVQYAEKGQQIMVKIIFMPIGKGVGNMNITLNNPDNQEIGKWVINNGNREKTVTFTAAETGIYQFKYSGAQGIRFESSLPGHGYLAANALSCNHVPGIMYFLVPAGVREVAVRVSGENTTETVTASLLNPQGRKVCTITKATEPQLLYYVRNNPSEDEVWACQVHSAVDDFNIAIMGKAIPILTSTPDGLFQQKH